MIGLNDVMEQAVAYGLGEEEGRASSNINWKEGIPTDQSVDYLLEFSNKAHRIGKWNGECFEVVYGMHCVLCRIQADTVRWVPITD